MKSLFSSFLFVLSVSAFSQQLWFEKIPSDSVLTIDEEKKLVDEFWESSEGKQLEKETGKRPGYKQFLRKYYRAKNYGSYGPDERLSHRRAIADFNNLNNMRAQRSAVCKNWEFIGPKIYPAVIPSSSLAYTFPLGKGVVRSIDYSRQNNNIIYAGCELGGFWKSTDFGLSWTEVSQNYFHGNDITEIEVNPFNGNQIFARVNNVWYYSSDAGKTWAAKVVNGYGGSVMKIKYSNTVNGLVIVANTTGVYKSTNGGTTWVKVNNNFFSSFEFNPLNNNVLYAISTAGVSKIFRSNDLGQNWYAISSGLPSTNYSKEILGVTPADTSVLYLFQATSSNFTKLYKTGNAGQSWSLQLSSSNMLNNQAFWSCAFAVSRTNANVLFAGGLNLHKSTDGGLSFTSTSDWVYSYTPSNNMDYCHADIQNLKFINNSDSLLITNDGGVFFSSNLGATYSDLSEKLNISEVWGLDVSLSDTNFYCVGTWHNGSYHFGRNFTKIDGTGDGFGSQVHPTQKRFYNSNQTGSIKRNWYWGNNNFSVAVASSPISSASFYFTKYKLDKKNPTIIYTYHANEIYKSVNEGSSYTQIFNYTLFDLELYDQNGNYFYAISNNTALNRTLLKSTDGGNTISQINLPVGMDYLYMVDVHPFDSNQVLVLRKWQYGSYTGGAVFKSNDGGNTWLDLTKNLPPVPVYDVAFDTTGVGDIYIATDGDVLYTNSNLNGWLSAANGWPQIPVFEMILDWKNRRLVAGTWGRGVWELSLKNTPPQQTDYFTICPGEDTLISNIYINMPGTYTDTIQGYAGCDSLINKYIVTWDLPVNCNSNSIADLNKENFSLEFTDGTYFVNTAETKINYSLYSIDGKMMKTGNISEHEKYKLSFITDFSKGIYILLLQSDSQRKSYKIKN